MRRSDRFHLNTVVGATLAVMVGVVAFFELVGPVGTDARDRVGQETDSGTVVVGTLEVAATNHDAEPTHAPIEPVWIDSLVLCGVRHLQVTGEEVRIFPPYRLRFRSCVEDVREAGPWRGLVR